MFQFHLPLLTLGMVSLVIGAILLWFKLHFLNEKSSWGLFVCLYCLFFIYIFSLIMLIQIFREVLRSFFFFYCYILRTLCICWVKVLNLLDFVLIIFVCFSVYGLTLILWKAVLNFDEVHLCVFTGVSKNLLPHSKWQNFLLCFLLDIL